MYSYTYAYIPRGDQVLWLVTLEMVTGRVRGREGGREGRRAGWRDGVMVHITMYICICAHARIYIYIYTYTRMNIYMYTYLHIYVYIYSYIYIYTYMYICIYIYIFKRPLQTRSTKTHEVQDCAAQRPSYMNIYIYTLKGIWRFVVCETGGTKYKRNTSPSSTKTFHVAGFV